MAGVRTNTAYHVVAETLRRRIARGEFAAGAQLPTETQLCEAFATSRITVRRAMAILEDERLIRRQPGSGTFVNPPSSRKIALLSTDFSGSVARGAPRLRRRLEAMEWREASGDVAELLQVHDGARVLYAMRVDCLDGEAAAYDEVYLPEAMAEGLDEADLGRVDFLERWQEAAGRRLARVQQSVEAMVAERAQMKRLHVRRGSPLLKEISTYFLAGGAVAGVFVTYYRHDVFRVVSSSAMPMDAPPAEGRRARR